MPWWEARALLLAVHRIGCDADSRRQSQSFQHEGGYGGTAEDQALAVVGTMATAKVGQFAKTLYREASKPIAYHLWLKNLPGTWLKVRVGETLGRPAHWDSLPFSWRSGCSWWKTQEHLSFGRAAWDTRR